MRDTDWCWRWLPRKGASPTEINARLEQALADCIDYGEGVILGFPGTTPSEVAIETHRKFVKRQLNNLGYHTKPDPSEMGFCGTQELEKEFIYGVAEMLGVRNPETEIDGYICAGGTEGNDHGLWLARNKLWKERRVTPREARGIVVLHSFLFHYSLGKAFGRLLEGDPLEPREARRGVIYELPTNGAGELDPATLERAIRYHFAEGYRRFAVFLTVGAINLGSIDPVYEICEMLARLRNALDIGVAVHVDAAFGGFVVPFLEPDCRFAFQHPLVTSVSLDAHKMGGIPYSAGVFLCRKGLLEKYTSTDAPYIFSHKDHTVPGSRSGAIAAACWATLKSYGWEGYREIAERCMETRNYLIGRFQAVRGVTTYPSRMNLLTVHLPKPLDEALRQKYCIVPDRFPHPLSSCAYDEKNAMLIRRDRVVYRFAIMPHVTAERIDQFFREWNR